MFNLTCDITMMLGSLVCFCCCVLKLFMAQKNVDDSLAFLCQQAVLEVKKQNPRMKKVIDIICISLVLLSTGQVLKVAFIQLEHLLALQSYLVLEAYLKSSDGLLRDVTLPVFIYAYDRIAYRRAGTTVTLRTLTVTDLLCSP